MNMLAQFAQNQKTMSSREIAHLCEKQHAHVCRDIDSLNETYEKMGLSKIGEGYYTHPNTGSQQHREFLLSKEQSIDLVTGYNSELRIKINRRWAELESQLPQPSYMIEDPIERAKKWIEEEKQKQAVIHQLEIAAPKAQALDVLSNSHGTETVDNCAHAMGIQPRKTLRPWMERNNWIHKDKDGQWRAKSDRIMAGHLKEASRVITDTSGKPRHKVTVYVTPKGKALLTTRLIQAGIIKGVAA